MTTPQGMLAEVERLLTKIIDLAHDEDVGEPLDDAIGYANKALFALVAARQTAAPNQGRKAITPSGRVHKLKTWPQYFEAIISGKKQFECRVDDRRFEVGDTLILQEWQPVRENYSCKEGHYTGREIERVVTFLFSTQPTNERVVVMSLSALTPAVAPDGAREIERLRRCIGMAMGCIDPESSNPDERLAWHRLYDALQGREPRDALARPAVVGIEGREPLRALVDHAQRVLLLYDKAVESQASNGPDAKLTVIAHYGEIAINLLCSLIAALARHPHQPVEDNREATLSKALTDVRQELWVDYCLHMGRTDTDPSPFNSKPHIRIIDSALAHSLEPATEAKPK